MQELTRTEIRYHPDPCPECGAKLFLTTTKHGQGYLCENLYEYGCRGNAGAHEDGRPMGVPGNQWVRTLRRFLHNETDYLWMQYHGEKGRQVRTDIYEFMRQELEDRQILQPGQKFHVGELNEEQLRVAIQVAQTTLKRRFR